MTMTTPPAVAEHTDPHDDAPVGMPPLLRDHRHFAAYLREALRTPGLWRILDPAGAAFPLAGSVCLLLAQELDSAALIARTYGADPPQQPLAAPLPLSTRRKAASISA